MARHLHCDLCGSEIEQNYNESGIVGRYGPVAVLCTLHYHAARQVAVDGVFNWQAMCNADIQLNRERPSLLREPEKWSDWDPLGRLVELYQEAVLKFPEDWPKMG
ncbi:MAG: hypothetical protein FJ125_08025 [Deltaproteobacteria bacterium]|nr:hypothetical protein [Deltaproteobacteria bacterium]